MLRLPAETIQIIISHLPTNALKRVSLVNQNMFVAADKERSLRIQRVKELLVNAHDYQRADKQHYFYHQLYQLLSSFPEDPLTKRYQCLRYLLGLTAVIDLEQGLMIFEECLDANDYRAAELLLSVCVEEPSLYIEISLHEKFEQLELTAMTLLTNNHKNNPADDQLNTILSKYQHLKDTIEEPEIELQQTQLAKTTIPNHNDKLTENSMTMNYQLGYDCYDNADYEQALEFLETAYQQGSADAAYLLATMYDDNNISSNQEHQAATMYLAACSLGSDAANQYIFNTSFDDIQNPTIYDIATTELGYSDQDMRELLKQSFIAENSLAAQYLSALYRDMLDYGQLYQASLSEIATVIWWIQLAAQCGCQDSQNFLVNNVESHPYFKVALGILYSFGAPEPGFLAADKVTATAHFTTVSQKDPNTIDEYIEAGKEENVVESYVGKLLYNHLRELQFPDMPTTVRI